MKPGVAFVAYSLHPDDDALHVSTLDGHRIKLNQIQESTFSSLEMYNERGLDAAAMIIGKHVLGSLYLANPEKFKQYPNLVMEIPRGPSLDEVARMNERLRQLDEEN